MNDLVRQYHDGTKHHFHRFARSLGYLDWATQPAPFRAFIGAPAYQLYPGRPSEVYEPPALAYDRLFEPWTAAPAPFTATTIGDWLRHALGLSAWKRFRQSRWALRVNPSSGNLHPTEAYLVCATVQGLADTPALYHYAPDRHALELRCRFDGSPLLDQNPPALAIAALTSIHWREAWKYGERAFRYCQHDLGHAIAALRLAAAMFGWTAVLLREWSYDAVAAVTGVDRDEDFIDAEREEAGCALLIASTDAQEKPRAQELVSAVRQGTWFGRASQLSEDHVEWPFIDEVARHTRLPSLSASDPLDLTERPAPHDRLQIRQPTDRECAQRSHLDARALLLQRRSALAFDGRSTVDQETFFRMLARAMPAGSAPWDAAPWSPAIHLALFVHRVDDLAPGLYLLVRAPAALERLRSALRRDFEWEPAHAHLPLLRLARGDCRALAQRVSCDQEIAAAGFFSLGMIAEFDASLEANGPSFYRNLFWESGIVGQVLYLEAEAAGARATGIGCFYDDPVHDVLGLIDHRFQSLYHFTIGCPVDDPRLTTEKGYAWEAV